MNYNETVLDHFANPRNVGKIHNYDAKGETGNPADGDRIIVYLRIHDNRLEEVRFQTYGCAAAIAASSMLTELATGKTIEKARGITNEDVAQALGGLPPQKHTCSNIAADALQNALNAYEARVNFQQDIDDSTCQENMEETARQQASNLTPLQVQRYLRQIIMPEISGRGQETLLATHVMVTMPSVEWGEMMLAYLAAVGVGQVTCVLDDMNKGSEIIRHLIDLNPEMQLKVMHGHEHLASSNYPAPNAFIVIGPTAFVEPHGHRRSRTDSANEEAMRDESGNLAPEIFVEIKPWHGTLHINTYEHNQTSNGHDTKMHVEKVYGAYGEKLTLGEGLSASFGGTMAVIQLVKLRLNIGNQPDKPLAYDLLNMKFGLDIDVATKEGFPGKMDNAQKHLNDDNLRQRLAEAKVLLIGSGGLGSPSAFALAKAGVGTLGLVDHDQVDLSNLNRQILHTTSRIGIPKVESGAKTLQMINPDMKVHTYQERMTEENVDRLLQKYDLLLDGLDNLPSRYVANRAAVAAGKPFIQAGVLTFYGQSTSILPGESPCYECVFPQSESNGNAPTCEETGVLGAVPGLMGVIQAAETVKQLCGIKPSLHSKYLMVDVLENEFTIIDLPARQDCSLCQE